MIAKGNKFIVHRLAQVIKTGNLDDLASVLAPNQVGHDPDPPLKDFGREEYKQAFLRLRLAFPDAEWKLRNS